MSQNQLVDPPGVVNHPEMGGLVLLYVHGADLDLVKINAVFLHGEQHIGFVLKPVALDLG